MRWFTLLILLLPGAIPLFAIYIVIRLVIAALTDTEEYNCDED